MSVADIAADPQYQARHMIVHIPDERLPGGEVVMPGIVPQLTETPGIIRHSGREIGADNYTVYHNLLGLSKDEITHFQSEGVI
jgi:crotonobetainyl-CoA:carnitine CoA-transferase CaiB-like acyl-CoA transferase